MVNGVLSLDSGGNTAWGTPMRPRVLQRSTDGASADSGDREVHDSPRPDNAGENAEHRTQPAAPPAVATASSGDVEAPAELRGLLASDLTPQLTSLPFQEDPVLDLPAAQAAAVATVSTQ